MNTSLVLYIDITSGWGVDMSKVYNNYFLAPKV